MEYIEVTPEDIKAANQLAHEVLGRSLNELPPQTLTLLKHIQHMVKTQGKQQSIEQADYRFSRKDIRNHTGWSDGQLKIHCSRLTDLEYLLTHQGSRGKSLVYELIYDGELTDKNHLMGLIDPDILNYDEKKSGQTPEKTAPSQGQVSPKLGASQGSENSYKANGVMALRGNKSKTPEKGYIEGKTNDTSPIDHNGLYPYLLRFTEWGNVKGLSPATVKSRDRSLRRFIVWCDERSLNNPTEITKPILERYQKHLYYYRKNNGEPLSHGSQHALLAPIKAFFKWLCKENYIPYNPASELELPRQQRGLPKAILSIEEIDTIMGLPDIKTPYGIRDRAILETLYS
ncbi:MAG: site-specific integrase, partial [Gammaproteobacteria bacterium]|nr:site-specific integrase [Gammaproteobacteria bacterium]